MRSGGCRHCSPQSLCVTTLHSQLAMKRGAERGEEPTAITCQLRGSGALDQARWRREGSSMASYHVRPPHSWKAWMQAKLSHFIRARRVGG